MVDKKLWLVCITKGYPEPSCDSHACKNCSELARYYVTGTRKEVEAWTSSTKLHVELIELPLLSATHHIDDRLKELEEEHL
jgi:hypothetical protein